MGGVPTLPLGEAREHLCHHSTSSHSCTSLYLSQLLSSSSPEEGKSTAITYIMVYHHLNHP